MTEPSDHRREDPARRAAERHVDALRPERPATLEDRLVRVGVDDPVVLLAGRRVVGRRVVDDVVGTERADEVQLGRAGDARHLGAQALGDLDGERADVARRTDDQDLVALPGRSTFARPQPLDREDRRVRKRGGSPRTTSRRGSSRMPSPARTRTPRRNPTPYAYRSANTRSPGRKRVTAGPTASTTPAASSPRLWFLGARNADEQAHEPGLGRQAVEIGPIDRRGDHADEDLVVRGDRPLDLAQLDDVGRAVSIPEGGPHHGRRHGLDSPASAASSPSSAAGPVAVVVDDRWLASTILGTPSRSFQRVWIWTSSISPAMRRTTL